MEPYIWHIIFYVLCGLLNMLQDFSTIFPQLESIKAKIRQKIDETLDLSISLKEDRTVVTEIDLFVSDLFRDTFIKKPHQLNFFSEEEQGKFEFPMIILDPIDGTRELIAGIGECAVSFGIYYSPNLNDPRNFSWIYNPFTNIELSSESEWNADQNLNYPEIFNWHVSRSEYEKKLFREGEKSKITPVGSIANKLMLLALGRSDGVISKKPKNIWDIMAGSHICYKRGIKLLINGKEINALNEKTYPPILIWSQYSTEKFQI